MLSIGDAGATSMACPEALMNQEHRLLDLLPAVKGYSVDDTGALILSTSDGKTITARRR